MQERSITVSVVSHRQNALVNQLLMDIQRHCADRVALILTENAEDSVALDTENLSCPVERISNRQIRGFGANHNAAFIRSRTPFFCVTNPDIRLRSDPFSPLLQALADSRTAVAGPLVRSSAGNVEDSARRFPTASLLLKKVLHEKRQPDYSADGGEVNVDWIAGMFMLFRSETYRWIGGFDESYFLYYEDVDLCRRLHVSGKTVRYAPAAEVVHDARRSSRRNLQYLMWHAQSILRYLSTSY